jgi:DNA-binding CsgD family transcriptional regulator
MSLRSEDVVRRTKQHTGRVSLSANELEVYEMRRKAMSYQEIADARGTTLGTVKSAVQRIRDKGFVA